MANAFWQSKLVRNHRKTIEFFNIKSNENCLYKAFTLSEVLITLGIIGVVAAIVLSVTIIIKENQMRTAWKSNYSIITSVISRMRDENGGDLESLFEQYPTGYESSIYFKNEFKKHIKYIQEYNWSGSGYTTFYYNVYLKDQRGNQWPQWNYASGSQLALANGAVYILATYKTGSSQEYVFNWARTDTGKKNLGVILVDVNGFKPPNEIGYDVYGVVITSDSKTSPMGDMYEIPHRGCPMAPTGCAGSGNGWNCVWG